VGYKILEGSCGDVDLSGAVFVGAADWPKAIHDGNGTIAAFFDTSVSQQQMEALGAILTNQYGGLPWEIFATTFTTMLDPIVESIEMKINGTKSSIKIGDKLSASMTPHVNPIEPSEEQEVHVVLPTGFVFTDAKAAKNMGQKVNVEGMQFEDKDCNAFFALVEHGN
jgi:hypothetical protein